MSTSHLFLTILLAVLGSNGLWSFLQSFSKTRQARDQMILGLGHAEIFRLCERYLERGGITKNELEDLTKYLYKPYKDLGGNGTAETLVNRCKQLPIISENEAEKRDGVHYDE